MPMTTSTAVYLVCIPGKSSVLAELFDPDPRWGGRYRQPHCTEGEPLFGRIEVERNGGGGVTPLSVLFTPGHNTLER